MAASQEFIDFVVELLEPVGHIEVSRMFGGALLKVEGKQLGIVADDILYFKVTDPTLQKQLRDEGSVQFSYPRKDKSKPVVIQNWWSAPDRYIDNSEELLDVAEHILEE